MAKKTICIDFDGVIHDYSNGFQGEDVFGEAVHGADAATSILRKNGWCIIIYTTRPVTETLKTWLKEHKISFDYINENPDQPKGSEGCKLIADVYLDDRAVSFRGHWDWTMNEIASFKPWQTDKEDLLKKMADSYEEGSIWAKGCEKRISCSK